MRNYFVKTLCELCDKHENIYLITGDLGFGVLTPFIEKHSERFINAGIAEQNMTGVAAGIALGGNIVFTYSIGNFPTLRCLEQIRNDCLYNNLDVKVICVGSGFTYGALGMSHHATEDIGIMSSLPNIHIFSPCDEYESRLCTELMVKTPGTCYMRLGRGGNMPAHTDNIINYKIGDVIKIRDGKDVCIFFTGDIFNEIDDGCRKFNLISPAIYSTPCLKPINGSMIAEISRNFKYVITIEEHNVINGLGSIIANVFCDNKISTNLIKLGIKDIYCSHVGDQKYLRKIIGIDSDSIASIFKQIKNKL